MNEFERQLYVGVPLSLNVFSSLGCIFANKYLFRNFSFNFGTFLTVCHFVVTYGLCYACGQMGIFKPKSLPWSKVLPISLAFCGYVVFNNLSLLHNSVSFYQIMKILCTPFILFVQSNFYGEHVSTRIKLCLIPVCMGIFIAVLSDTQVNPVGTLYALLAVVANAMYTIWGKTKQRDLQADSLQVLFPMSILSALILVFFVPVFDSAEEVCD